jgi:hypothetical protein
MQVDAHGRQGGKGSPHRHGTTGFNYLLLRLGRTASPAAAQNSALPGSGTGRRRTWYVLLSPILFPCPPVPPFHEKHASCGGQPVVISRGATAKSCKYTVITIFPGSPGFS